VVLASGNAKFALQEQQLGTGHAVRCALPHLPGSTEAVVILCGDVPLITANTIQDFLDDHKRAGRDVSLLAVEVENPKGYGRVILDEDRNLTGIVEESDATERQKRVRLINTGIYCVKKAFLADALQQIRADNSQEEYYLTDIIEIAYKEKKVVGVTIGPDAEEFVGVNTNQDLLTVQAIMRKRLQNST
jgi:bifunctional UDP-N-acetylglucosamine pyrophosphorylase/glucosamine-1-phosphate N-acetyltransferase/UDP-N-acetylglucosamine pyrophosphorylase